ncbi:hypothetical protein AVEN_15938-1 [Araneus ventricosus]|uniref:Uncharacterized protein n=1 Tax=Araneus ventricosus TaxID=182803 RepID=A0A4Y2WPB5_ARAVE|nr:hypothetical protein AVEN_15938-1 [Araneus ventricosus]
MSVIKIGRAPNLNCVSQVVHLLGKFLFNNEFTMHINAQPSGGSVKYALREVAHTSFCWRPEGALQDIALRSRKRKRFSDKIRRHLRN